MPCGSTLPVLSEEEGDNLDDLEAEIRQQQRIVLDLQQDIESCKATNPEEESQMLHKIDILYDATAKSEDNTQNLNKLKSNLTRWINEQRVFIRCAIQLPRLCSMLAPGTL